MCHLRTWHGSGREGTMEILIAAAVFVAFIILQIWVLPKLGVTT